LVDIYRHPLLRNFLLFSVHSENAKPENKPQTSSKAWSFNWVEISDLWQHGFEIIVFTFQIGEKVATAKYREGGEVKSGNRTNTHLKISFVIPKP